LNEFVISLAKTLIQRTYFYIFVVTKFYTNRKMKKILLLLAICGTMAVASCTKHACPAYGSVQKAAPSAPAHRV
jgi:hypothetical protein